MLDFFKDFLETILGIKTILTFWSFFGFLGFLSYYFFLKNSKGFQSIVHKIIETLSKAGLYKMIRLFIILVFILLVVMAFLLVFAPILNNYIDKKLSNRELSDAIDKIELNEKYSQIIRLYESHQYELAKVKIKEIFDVQQLNSLYDVKGYMVPTYLKIKDYESAARIVLERDKTNAKWDFKLLRDLVICLSRCTEERSLLYSLNLVDKLSKDYKSKLLSHIWCAMPEEVYLSMSIDRTHSVGLLQHFQEERQINKEEVSTIIKTYPEDPFLEYGYYLIQDYETALKINPNSLIKDIILYAAGYDLIRRVNEPSRVASSTTAYNYFKELVQNYATSPHSDDATYWLARMEINKDHPKLALNWLLKSSEVGNQDIDYQNLITKLEISLLLSLPINKSLPFVYNETNKEKRYNLLVEILKSQSVAKDLEVLKNKSVAEFKNEVLIDLAKYHYRSCDFDNAGLLIDLLSKVKCNEDYNEYDIKFLRKAIPLITLARKSNNIKNYARAGSLLRRKFSHRTQSICILEEGISRFHQDKEIDYLHYLKIIAIRDLNPSSVEAHCAKFYNSFPQSQYADDILAELAFTQLRIYNDINKGEKTVRMIQKTFPTGNAKDNSLNCLALSYYYEWLGGDDSYYIKSINCYSDIIKKFPHTRFARNAIKQIIEIKKGRPKFEEHNYEFNG